MADESRQRVEDKIKEAVPDLTSDAENAGLSPGAFATSLLDNSSVFIRAEIKYNGGYHKVNVLGRAYVEGPSKDSLPRECLFYVTGLSKRVHARHINAIKDFEVVDTQF